MMMDVIFFLRIYEGCIFLGGCPLPKFLGSGSVRVNLFYSFFLVKGILIL